MANMSEEWNQSVEDQGSEQEQAVFAENQRAYDGYHSLVEQDRMARQQRKRAADIALASMLIEARNSGNGMVPASMCAAVSQDCGMDIAGGVLTKDGNLHLLTHAQDGSVVEFPNGSGIITPANQFGVLQRTGLGKDLQKEIYGGFRKKYTAQQLAKIGVKEPIDTLKRDGVEVVGGTDPIKTGNDRASMPGPRSRFISQDDIDGRPYKDPDRPGVRYLGHGISSFSTTDWKEDRDEKRFPNGRWKVRVNGPDGKVYENDKTGEEVTVKPGENLRDVLAKSETTQKDKTGAGVEIAKINAASREKVAGMTTGSREKISEGNNQTRREIAGAQIASREKIAEAANVLKQYGIDVSAELKERGYDLQEKRNAEVARHNKESEGIAGSRLREQERHNRAGEEVADRRASAQEQRVEDQYELGDRKQRHNENRLQNDKEKAARAAGQRDAELAERKRQFDEREKRLSKPKDQGGAGEDSRKAVSAMKGMLELARSSGMSEEDLADLESWTNERIKGLAGIGGETSGDGGTKGKVKYTDLKPGQKFTMTDKDGKKRRCVKTEKGYKYID